MRFEVVRAEAFGGLSHQELRLTPGMTIICGPNEAAKSTWHAALYAALCGMRRGRGQPRRADRAFEDRHRPWDNSSEWAVSAVVELDDGRRFEIRQDLAAGLDNYVHDLGMGGREVTSDVLHEGMPDGARWLGLDRDSFSAVACIRQAEILRVLDAAGQLQEDLQRAAASSRADTTAALALERIEAFHREHVGLDRANSTKPMRASVVRVNAAELRLGQVRQQHEKFVAALEQAESLQQTLVGRQGDRAVLEAARALNTADDLKMRASRAAELTARHPAAPRTLTDDNDVATRVASALSAHRQRPEVPDAPPRASDEIQRELDALPAKPEGDTEVAATLAAAHDAYFDALRSMELHQRTRPSDPVVPDSRGLSADQLRHLADTLDQPAGAHDDVRDTASLLPSAQPAVARPAHARRGRALIGAGGALVVVGAVLALAASVVAGLVALAIGVVVALVGITRTVGAQAAAGPTLDEAHIRAEAARRVEEDRVRQRVEAVEELRRRGLPEDAARVRDLVERITAAEHDRRTWEEWQELDAPMRDDAHRAEERLRAELDARGVNTTGVLVDAWTNYVSACDERRALAAEASRRPSVQADLTASRAAEAGVRHALEVRADATAAVREAAATCGVEALDERSDDELAAELEGWLRQRAERLRTTEVALQEWEQLQGLLDGRTLSQLEEARDRVVAEAARFAARADSDRVAAALEHPDLDAEVRAAREAEQTALGGARRAEGEVHTLGAELPSVAEAEEALALAREQLAYVQRLAGTLERAATFLRDAQDAVHRDVATFLAEPLRSRVPRITNNRYVDVLIDPSTLEIRLRTAKGHLRSAELLSHGTAEQVYLLLRVALAEHLTNGETCPLLLDDVTTQTDPERTRGVLELLHEISATHQVVMFSQEDDVLSWGRAHLTDPRDRVVELDGSLIEP